MGGRQVRTGLLALALLGCASWGWNELPKLELVLLAWTCGALAAFAILEIEESCE
jgi:hypothetical protein